MRTAKPIAERFRDRIAKGKQNQCWMWLGATNGRYGVINLDHRAGLIYAHRLSYKLHHNIEPGSLLVLHRCDVPLCVNPHHLFLGTQTDNMRDASRKGRTWRGGMPGTKNGRAKLSEDDVRFIRSSPETNVALADRFGVYETMIGRIKLGKAWRHVI